VAAAKRDHAGVVWRTS